MEQITKEQALNNLISVANQVKYTLQDGEAIKQSIQILVQALASLDNFIARDLETVGTVKSKEENGTNQE